jgi:ABC-type transport system involved in multi-copper enzyme maturation permease subunit
MDTPAPRRPAVIKRWLPYWAVLQADFDQTLRSWVYRVWVLASVLAASGYLLYRIGVQREAGMVQSASDLISDLLRWSVLGGVALIIILTGGTISSERGIMADSVLSRGISRYQYFLGKWHARLAVVSGTFLMMGLVVFGGSFFFLHEDLHLMGSLLAICSVLALLGVVTTCGVTMSAISNSTVVGIAVLWILIYGAGIALTLLLPHQPTPGWVLNSLPQTLRGYYDFSTVSRLLGWSAGGSVVVALIGLAYFGRRDV